jgi:CubicO group peptidase (beta-lactamase class C family)
MKRTLSLHIILSLLSLIFYSCQGFKQFIEPGKLSESKKDFTGKVDSLVISKMNQYNIPGLAIGLVAEDSIIYARGYGIKNIRRSDPVTENSNFHTASISKLFTAQAVMMLIKKNELSLDERLLTIIPELKYSDKRVEEITIRSLLNHSSGLPDVANYHWRYNNQSDKSLEDYILGLNLKLKWAPSTKYHYSNLGYNILGYVIEKVTKTSFDLYLKENILNANGMINSDFRYYKIPDSLKTSPHSKNRITKKIYKRKTYPYTREQAPGSTLNSSAKDLSKWMISFLKSMDDMNSENAFAKMTKPSFSSYPHIGLGFQLSKLDGKPTIGHYGGDKGYRSYLLMVPEKKLGLVLLANCDYNEDFRQEIIHPITKLMLTLNSNMKLQ